MPNHITNKLEIIGTDEQIKKVLNYIKVEENIGGENDACGLGTIDFNKIIPMSEDLLIEVPSNVETMAKVAMREEYNNNSLIAGLEADNREHSKSPSSLDYKQWKLFIRALNNKWTYDAYYWYDWRNKNWDTKWSAYGLLDDRTKDNIVFFKTAWSYPEKIITKLSKIFEDIEIKIWWASEDLSYNIGMRKYINGNVIDEYVPDGGSLDAKKLFFDITGDTLEEHYMNENYEYIEEE